MTVLKHNYLYLRIFIFHVHAFFRNRSLSNRWTTDLGVNCFSRSKERNMTYTLRSKISYIYVVCWNIVHITVVWSLLAWLPGTAHRLALSAVHFQGPTSKTLHISTLQTFCYFEFRDYQKKNTHKYNINFLYTLSKLHLI